MNVSRITPILNVSNVAKSFAWFEKLGWKTLWDWGGPPTVGAVGSGKVEISLCLGAQGSRSGAEPKFAGDETGGVWMSWFLNSSAEVDAVGHDQYHRGQVFTRPALFRRRDSCPTAT